MVYEKNRISKLLVLFSLYLCIAPVTAQVSLYAKKILSIHILLVQNKFSLAANQYANLLLNDSIKGFPKDYYNAAIISNKIGNDSLLKLFIRQYFIYDRSGFLISENSVLKRKLKKYNYTYQPPNKVALLDSLIAIDQNERFSKSINPETELYIKNWLIKEIKSTKPLEEWDYVYYNKDRINPITLLLLHQVANFNQTEIYHLGTYLKNNHINVENYGFVMDRYYLVKEGRQYYYCYNQFLGSKKVIIKGNLNYNLSEDELKKANLKREEIGLMDIESSKKFIKLCNKLNLFYYL